MDLSLYRINKMELAAKTLAALGTEKKIVNMLLHRRKDNIKQFWKDLPYARQFRRGQGGWAKSADGRLMADRILSLYKTMYKDKQLDKTLTAVQLLNLYYAYNALYPGSKIHPTRIYYFFPLVREQKIAIMPSCSCCSKSYVVHFDDNTDSETCGACIISNHEYVDVNDTVSVQENKSQACM
ncbi:FlhC family transcriptional regulator [Pseudoalteromonas sp. SK20]|uniref:FlhC family transcriptional regulator n=1 Tax=Pseudoalteromonas sp. SK20 TaxID=1938367 RepID=UPI000976B09B|nr:FlhC family transcriptional regulator [Pseudoalteromonas sp. SK20]